MDSIIGHQGPYHVERTSEDTFRIVDGKGFRACVTPDEVNASRIVRALNCFGDLDAAADEAWKALAWIIHYDSEDKALARAMKQIEDARKKAGTYDYDAMRARVEASKATMTAPPEARNSNPS